MQRYTVGRNIKGKSDPVTVEADALAAALQAKQEAPDATITYVRKCNERRQAPSTPRGGRRRRLTRQIRVDAIEPQLDREAPRRVWLPASIPA
jgi:hypothetical protein